MKKPTQKRIKTSDLDKELGEIKLKGDKLSPFHEMFIMYYCGIGQETFGNATRAYMKAYGYPAKVSPKRYNVARNCASVLLTIPNIKRRIDETLDTYSRHDIVDRERMYVISQRSNVVAKVMAIKTYDELKGRITKKLKLSGAVKADLNDKQMAQMAAIALKKLEKKK